MKRSLKSMARAIYERYRRWKNHLLCALAFVAFAGVAALLWPMDVDSYLRTCASTEVLDRSGRLMYAFFNEDEQWCFPRELHEISTRLVQATVAVEDQRFYRHPGVDPAAIVRAAWQNATQQRLVSGASTLTMQVVKGAEHTPRSLAGKLVQTAQAVRLECRVSKDRILETYLNTAPYGMNLVGCEAAARRYFGKPARELTLAEAALIAGLPKAPVQLMPLKYPKRAKARRNYVLARMLAEGYITKDQHDRARGEPLGVRWHELPRFSPHLAMRLSAAERGRIVTTLDRHVQSTAERLAAETVRNFAGQFSNAAVIVVDVPTACVLAWVGSADFFSNSGGQVDVCRAPRSPGSALKPFVYALAMENHCLYGSEILLDNTLDYGRYNPENFDLNYRGLVSASDALKHSLNVPAVTVLERVGMEPTYALFRDMGLSTLTQSADYYGLGLTLGSCETRLDELTGAYCMLANLGKYRRIAVTKHAEVPPAKQLLSRGTCLKIFEILEGPLPGEFDRKEVQTASAVPRVCWKTGTSTGHRDAWAFVFNRQYLVGVWVGNNDGRPSKWLVGAQVALPLAARMFRSLEPHNDPDWPEPAGDLHEVAVCAVSGLPVSSWCVRTKRAVMPRNHYLNRICDMHYPLPGGAHEVVERWPGAAKGWDLARIALPVVPGGSEEENRRVEALRILAPSDKSEYVLTNESNADRVRLLSSLDDRTPLHWYLNDRYCGTSSPTDPLFIDLAPGDHKLVCMADGGSVDEVAFKVEQSLSSILFRE